MIVPNQMIQSTNDTILLLCFTVTSLFFGLDLTSIKKNEITSSSLKLFLKSLHTSETWSLPVRIDFYITGGGLRERKVLSLCSKDLGFYGVLLPREFPGSVRRR